MPDTPPTCRIHEKYDWIKCANPSLPGDPEGLCILHSRVKNKDPEAFQAALQARWSWADQESYYFRGVVFPGPFDPQKLFGTREFDKDVDFSWATFTERANFSWATFTEGANFSGATFTKRADFFRATFTKEADFIRAAIAGAVVLRDINPSKKSGPAPPPFRGDFRELAFRENGVLRFQDVNLAHCPFTGTDLRRPEFLHVTWGSRGGRQVIDDEVSLREAEKETPWFWKWFFPWLSGHLPLKTFALEIGAGTGPYTAEESGPPEPPWGDRYGAVERLYRHLKINYLSEQDYKNAGDFHYGEMEMHRRASKWRWFPFYWYNLYRFLSGYGERPSRALGWLAAFLAIFTGLLAWAGLEILDPKYSAGFGNPFFYLLQKVTLQRPTWAEPVGFGGKLVAGLSVLFIPGQAALFLLALRNRLGRRR